MASTRSGDPSSLAVCGQTIGTARHQRELGALVEEQPRDTGADARAGTRDDRDHARQPARLPCRGSFTCGRSTWVDGTLSAPPNDKRLAETRVSRRNRSALR